MGQGSRAGRVLLVAVLVVGMLVIAPLGTGPVAAAPVAPEPVPETVAAVTTGFSHACVRTSTGRVRCWGQNTYGTLGTGDLRQRVGAAPGEMPDALVTVDLGAGRTATAVDAGGDTTCAVRDDGAVKCWGGNDRGQLGLGDRFRRGWLPEHLGDTGLVDLGAGRTATAVTVGGNHACALLDGGDVRCWGANSFGQLGIGDADDRGDAPDETGDLLPIVDLGPGRTATALTAGDVSTCALLDDGSVKCWGANFDGQLGLTGSDHQGDEPGEMGDALAPVALGTGRTATALSAGGRHVCAVLDTGAVKCWGDNAAGQLGQGDTGDRPRVIDQIGDALAPVDLGSGRTAVHVTAGQFHTCG